METPETKGLAVVTGASSGIGLELARLCARDGYDVIVCADGADIASAVETLQAEGGRAEAVRTDLGQPGGVAQLVAAIGDRPVDLLMANAGTGLGGEFLDQDIDAAMEVVRVNVAGTVMLIHAVGRSMRSRGKGRILITGSVAGYIPGSGHLMYNASKAFLDNFSHGLRDEVAEDGITVTCLVPGPVDTPFFERAEMTDSGLGEQPKYAPDKVARDGYEAMMRGDAAVTSGIMTKIQSALTGIVPPSLLADLHGWMAKRDRDER